MIIPKLTRISFFFPISLLVLLSISIPAFAEDTTPHQADSLLAKLRLVKALDEKFKIELRLARYFIRKQGESKSDLDSAKSYISAASLLLPKVINNGNSGLYCLTSAYWHNESGKKVKSEVLLDQAISYLSNSSLQSLLGEAYLEKQYHIEFTKSTMGERIRLTELALAAFERSKDKLRQADCLTLLADLRTYFGQNNDVGLEEIKRALQIRQAIHKPELQVYVLMARIYSSRANYKKALEITLKSQKLAEAQKDNKLQLLEYYNHLGLLYFRLNDDAQAITNWKIALDILNKESGQPYLVTILYNLGTSYIRQGRAKDALRVIQLAELKNHTYPKSDYFWLSLLKLNIFTNLKSPSLAQLYYNRVSLMLNDKDLEGFKWNSYSLMIKFCISSRQYVRADSLLQLNQREAVRGGEPLDLWNNYQLRFMLDTIRKDYHAATYDLLKVKTINDSIQKMNEIRALKEMQVQYETQKNENELKIQRQRITMLNQRQTLQEEKVQRADLVRNITIAGITSLLFFAALLRKQLSKRKEANRLILLKNGQLEHLLKENEWLLKEVHHRVKNNLQLITGLLNSQSVFLQDKAALNAIKESQRRVQSMAIIHQKLYKSSNYSSIYMPEYVRDLVEYLESSFSSDNNIYFRLEIEPVHLDIANAIPVGLIVNESVTNAIKYAFTKDGDYRIIISLSQYGDQVVLVISDNGVGLPEDFHSKASSFGLMLMKGLSEEMSGEFEISSTNDGTVITVSFVPTVIRSIEHLIAV
jgi:two-component sensor histidine kinase/tetratricopeptide (TPR) repeat protein